MKLVEVVKFSSLIFCLLHVYARAESRFVGWEGATYNPIRTWGRDPLDDFKHRLKNRKDSQPSSLSPPHVNSIQTRWIEQLSWKPRSYLFHNFLTEKECEYIIDTARPLLQRSTVVGNGSSEVNSIRTSFGTFLRRRADPVVEKISQRVAHWTHLPTSHQEDMQVLRYGHKQKYGAHMDVLAEGSPRLATVILYLSNVEEGGETSFVNSWNWIKPEQADRHGSFSECAQGHVSVKPNKGDALMFFSLTPSGVLDEASEHAGCPVLKGTKWTSTIWIHSVPFRRKYPSL
eukprot:g5617.t2